MDVAWCISKVNALWTEPLSAMSGENQTQDISTKASVVVEGLWFGCFVATDLDILASFKTTTSSYCAELYKLLNYVYGVLDFITGLHSWVCDLCSNSTCFHW